ncbi:MAG: Druantia anti-phage system protein DruA [Planctomycetota bacterium]
MDWRRVDGRLKDMSCRLAMLRMQNDGLIQLPPPQNGNNNGRPYRRRTPQAAPELFPVVGSAGALADLNLEFVTDRRQSHLWNEYIDRYHYLGYQPLPGAQLRYFARTGAAQQRGKQRRETASSAGPLSSASADSSWWSTTPGS